MRITIYTLADPISGEIKYVGITSTTLRERLSSHIKAAKLRKRKSANGRERWIMSLLSKDMKPVIEELETIDAEYKFIENYIEVYWMWQFKAWGFNLLNIKGLVNSYKYLNPGMRYRTPINQYDLDGNFIKRYVSIAEASKAVNGLGSLIQRAAKRKNGWKSYGYQWRYDEDFEKTIPKAQSKTLPNVNKKVAQIKNGQIIRIWRSGQEAAETLGLQKSKISNCCHNKRKTHGGFEWKFYDGK